jgi:hypothetical protein
VKASRAIRSAISAFDTSRVLGVVLCGFLKILNPEKEKSELSIRRGSRTIDLSLRRIRRFSDSEDLWKGVEEKSSKPEACRWNINF